MDNSELYIVIVTYNGAPWIGKCLGSVYNSSVKAEVVVIDNDSTDDTISIISRHFPQCKLIVTGENLGFGKANNIGIKYAMEHEAEYVYLLNQDAWVEPDVFEKLISMHKRYPDYGILSPVQYTGDGSDLDTSFRGNAVSEERCKGFLADYCDGNLKSDTPYQTVFVMAAHWLLYVPHLKKVGLFSPAFPHYGEDANLTHRYRYHKYRIGICADAKAYHDRQYRKVSPEKELYMRYIHYITLMNNPLVISRFQRIKGKVVFILRSLKLRGVSMQDKIAMLRRGFKEGKQAKIYLAEYIKVK